MVLGSTKGLDSDSHLPTAVNSAESPAARHDVVVRFFVEAPVDSLTPTHHSGFHYPALHILARRAHRAIGSIDGTVIA
jgi:hypothetical protein